MLTYILNPIDLNMIVDIAQALVYAGIPVAVFSYYLVMLTRGSSKLTSNNATELKKELKEITLEHKQDESFFVRILQKKFVKFGGGFYGILALMTYLYVEFNQFVDFFKNFTSLSDFIDSIGFKMLINFFIEAIMNLVTAFMWPIYWLKILPVGSLWVWLAIAFLAHWVATKYALSREV
jgi:hypothetical protein